MPELRGQRASTVVVKRRFARREFAPHGAPRRPRGGHDVLQDTIHHVLVENPQIPIGQKVKLEGLQLQAMPARLILDG